MSRNECCRYFKHMMNMTITEYLLEYRLSKAAALLESSDLSITEIAGQTGFCDVSYFIKMFRRKTGSTPKAYAVQRRLPQPSTRI
ncbi:MAG: AraC family transcriptional regulator [Blautia sp.]|nr:AraC family transcriptional regulator [Blautia sp.]